LRRRAIPQRLTGVFTTRRYRNPRIALPYLTLQYITFAVFDVAAAAAGLHLR